MVDTHLFVNTILEIGVVFIDFPARFGFNQRQVIGIVAIYFIGRRKNKHGFGAVLPGHFEQVQRTVGVYRKIGEGFAGGPIV